MDRLSAELERARRYGLALSLLMVDLDHFKLVNDTYGHPVGDEALRSTARVLQREARTVDVVARYGGEEFVVMLPETQEEGAVAVAERIRERIAEQAILPGASYDKARVTVSIGVATLPSARVNVAGGSPGAGGRGAVSRQGRGAQPGLHVSTRCPSCGTVYADDVKFCAKDGAKLLVTAPPRRRPRRRRSACRP